MALILYYEINRNIIRIVEVYIYIYIYIYIYTHEYKGKKAKP